mmetsp:Transcript_13515/g.28335  ORF Transcript_13515/g.28335 Transcript_13515/m.28335 type:complete len:91 (-) Transcript_13515:705-977(-)
MNSKAVRGTFEGSNKNIPKKYASRRIDYSCIVVCKVKLDDHYESVTVVQKRNLFNHCRTRRKFALMFRTVRKKWATTSVLYRAVEGKIGQ